MSIQKLVTQARIIVPFDGDEVKAQRLANLLCANAGDMYAILTALCSCGNDNEVYIVASRAKEVVDLIEKVR
jgi:hypothetical protein